MVQRAASGHGFTEKTSDPHQKDKVGLKNLQVEINIHTPRKIIPQNLKQHLSALKVLCSSLSQIASVSNNLTC